MKTKITERYVRIEELNKKEITRREAVLLFIFEHPEYKIINAYKQYESNKKINILNKGGLLREKAKKAQELRKRGFSLRNIAHQMGNVSHEHVRYLLKLNFNN
ncbi:hypothetical protein M0R04_12115 [Candidatus Dojkabacteria bacterium]|jgi:hypothetical protein|nr:hypothetical protein [Candidatus Dojkabacteria bacterium]